MALKIFECHLFFLNLPKIDVSIFEINQPTFDEQSQISQRIQSYCLSQTLLQLKQ